MTDTTVHTDPDAITPATTRAVRIERFGGLDVVQLADVSFPLAKDDEVVVRVRAASVNPVDWKTAEGKYPPKPASDLPFELGRDLAGTIENVGTRAHDMLSHGDRVMAYIAYDRGAQAEFVVVKAVELVAMPEKLDFAAAAGAGLASITAWQGLFDHGGLQQGQRVLIHGGAGGVGHLAVQFAKWKGCTVFTTVNGKDKDFARSLGADTAIDYENERFEDIATDLDLVFDTQGGETQARSFSLIRRGGTLVSTLDPDQERGRELGIHVPPRWHAEPNAAQLGEVVDLIDAGKVRVEVAQTFPLDQVRDAYRFTQEEHPRGKVVLTID